MRWNYWKSISDHAAKEMQNKTAECRGVCEPQPARKGHLRMQGLSSETQTSYKKYNEIMFMCWNVSSFRNLALGLCLNMHFIQIIPRCHSLGSQGSELMHSWVTQTDVHTAGAACSHRLHFLWCAQGLGRCCPRCWVLPGHCKAGAGYRGHWKITSLPSSSPKSCYQDLQLVPSEMWDSS